MAENCFYCQDELEERKHYVSFISAKLEREEPLCKECYQEWLEGIKG